MFNNKVSENPVIYVYDSPGIISPTIPDMHTGMKLALCGELIVINVNEIRIEVTNRDKH